MRQTHRFRAAVLLAAIGGWLSLSHEILWVRVMSGAWKDSPLVFGTTLGSLLVGVACGALIAPALQRRMRWNAMHYCAACLGLGAMLFWLLPGLASVVNVLSGDWGLVVLQASVALVAALMGGLLPAVARYGVPEDGHVGANVSVIYFGNVLGATIGPAFTGFLLLEWATVERGIFVVAAAGLLVAAVIAWVSSPQSRGQWLVVTGAALLLMSLGQRSLYDGFAERLHFRVTAPEQRYVYQAHGRVGSVGVLANDELYSGGLYDGGYNLNPAEKGNGILRAYLLPVLQPRLRRVLQIGLGSGSWTTVIARYPDVESLQVVEINPKYVDAMQRYPAIAATLRDPRVTLAIDDGRRWLRRHPHDTYDAIVVNATWHWRANATHLLSVESLRELRDHLTPGGMLYLNTTLSQDVMRTAAAVFAHVVRYENFIAASDRVLEMSEERRLQRLRPYARFLDSTGAKAVLPLLDEPLVDVAGELRAMEALRIVTDDNMATEFKTAWSGKWWRELPARAYAPERSWLAVLFP